MKLLLLHAWRDLRQLRRTHLNHSFALLKYAPEHDYTVHCFGRPIPPEVRHGCFDAIVLDVSFLCLRWARPRQVFDALKADYAFVAAAACPKIALPQDDSDHCAVLDQWLADWRVDHIFTSLARFRDVLYPLSGRHAQIHDALTGYVDAAEALRLARVARPFAERSIDIGYRAARLPPYFGALGRLKSEIGERFAAALPPRHGLALDIGNAPILGTAWLRFLGDCRFFLGTASGSSLADPTGAIQDATRRYLARHPRAAFDEIAAACFAGQDGAREFSALGPRHIEAAMAGTGQILVPGSGLAPLEPGVHYLPLAADMSNIGDVLEAMRDKAAVAQRIAECHRLFVADPQYRYPHFVARLLAAAGAITTPSFASLEAEAEASWMGSERVTERLWHDEAIYLRAHAVLPSPRGALLGSGRSALDLLRLCLPAGVLLALRRRDIRSN